MAQSSFRNLAEFFGSTAMALKAQGQRVRNLIGDAHWQSDGTYKERLLKNAIREIVPSTFKVGDGFLIYQKDKKQEHFEVSRQTDVLVYDDRFVAPIFRDGDFAIILAETALAAIEVKSSWGDNFKQLGDGIKALQSAHKLYKLARKANNTDLFTACIAYESIAPSNVQKKLSDKIAEKIIRQIKKQFIKGLSELWSIGPEITLDDLGKIKHYKLATGLCPQMIFSLDTTWMLVPGEVNSVDIKKWDCNLPVVRQISTISQNQNSKEVNLNLHLFLSTLRHRCIEWLYYNRSVPEFESMRAHLSNIIFTDQYPPICHPFSLITEIEKGHEIFPNVRFLK
ncbi:MAG: hypothetical protein ONB32_16605 [candidate division KSB1 bacterium]|nr:hypothetical protein [candidate division KSB1 bacterium]MDZ7341128.1 hypothetical protein [candidate division KSB1 bacterium]